MAEMRNLLNNPRPYDMSGWRSCNAAKLAVARHDDDRLFLSTREDGADLFAFTRLTVPAGTWRFGAQISTPQGSYASNALRFIQFNPTKELLNATWEGKPGRYVTAANTLTKDTQIELRVMCGPKANSAIWYRHLFLMTDADYQSMLDLGVDWFCGDFYDHNGGRPSDALVGYPPCEHWMVVA